MSPPGNHIDPEYVSARSRIMQDLKPYISVNIFDVDGLVSEDDNPHLRRWTYNIGMFFCGVMLLSGIIGFSYFVLNIFI